MCVRNVECAHNVGDFDGCAHTRCPSLKSVTPLNARVASVGGGNYCRIQSMTFEKFIDQPDNLVFIGLPKFRIQVVAAWSRVHPCAGGRVSSARMRCSRCSCSAGICRQAHTNDRHTSTCSADTVGKCLL
jgi:hypothetical protein